MSTINVQPLTAANIPRTSRRRFLARCSALVATTAVAPALLAEERDNEMKDRSLHELRYATFARQVKTRFRVQTELAGLTELELIEAKLAEEPPVSPGMARTEDAGNEKFSLIFSGPREALLPQRTYKFEHGKIGRFEMFITPILAKDTSRPHYQAVFNRPVKTETSKSKG